MFEVASSDLVNMGITVVSYTLKDIRDEEVMKYYNNNLKASILYHCILYISSYDKGFKKKKN